MNGCFCPPPVSTVRRPARTLGETFPAMEHAYGRCTSSLCVGRQRGGWAFLRHCRHEDTGKKFSRAAWVTVWCQVFAPQRLDLHAAAGSRLGRFSPEAGGAA
jgi:hypothetical protein